MYIPCKNDSTLSTDVSVGSSFFDNACCFHFLRIASYFDFVVSLHDSDNFCNLLWNFSASDCFPDNGTASSLIFGNSGCIACLFDDKINNFLLLGSWSGKSQHLQHQREPKLGLQTQHNHDPTAWWPHIFASVAPNIL